LLWLADEIKEPTAKRLKGNPMREIPELEAQGDFDRLLDDVEHGESVLITRNGRTIARFVPEYRACGSVDAAVKNIPQGLESC
jgi:prevent-host-death family protein